MNITAVPNSPGGNNRQFEIEFFGTPRTCAGLAAAALDMGTSGPLYIYLYIPNHPTNTSGWKQNNGSLDITMFEGCQYVSFAFSLQ